MQCGSREHGLFPEEAETRSQDGGQTITGYKDAPRSLCNPAEAGGCQPPGGWIYLCTVMWKFYLEKLFIYFIFANFSIAYRTCLFINIHINE